MKRESVTELLQNYPNYKCAMRQFERHQPMPSAGIANYEGMPSGSGAQELFFAPNGRMADMGGTVYQDRLDYNAYANAVKDIEEGLETLTDEERSVVKLKWIDKMSLQQIADRKGISLTTVKVRHKSALASLRVCYRFVKQPEIHEISNRGSQHFRHPNSENNTILF